jgi:hypothetical protein
VVEVAAEIEVETTKKSTFFRMEMEVTQLYRLRILYFDFNVGSLLYGGVRVMPAEDG